MRFFLRMLVWFLYAVLISLALLTAVYFLFGPVESKLIGFACGTIGGVVAALLFDPSKPKEDWR